MKDKENKDSNKYQIPLNNSIPKTPKIEKQPTGTPTHRKWKKKVYINEKLKESGKENKNILVEKFNFLVQFLENDWV